MEGEPEVSCGEGPRPGQRSEPGYILGQETLLGSEQQVETLGSHEA